MKKDSLFKSFEKFKLSNSTSRYVTGGACPTQKTGNETGCGADDHCDDCENLSDDDGKPCQSIV